MKKYLASVTVAVAMFATTTLSAASYWGTILEYLPDWRDFVPGMARPQIEEAQPANPASKAKPKPKVAVKPAPKVVVAPTPKVEPKPAVKVEPESPVAAAPKPPVVQSEPTVIDKKESAPATKRPSARRAKHVKVSQRKNTIQKPVSEPIEHPSKVSAPAMVLAINFEKGMQELASAVTKAPYAEKKDYNKNIMSGVLSLTDTLAKYAKSKAFSKANGQLNQAYKDLFPQKRGRKPTKKDIVEFQKAIVALGEIGRGLDTETLTNSYKTMLTYMQKTLKRRKINAESIYGQLVTMQILAYQAGHPSAIHLKKMLITADHFRKVPKDRTALEANIESVLKSL